MADSGAHTTPPLNLVFTTKEFNVFVDNMFTGKPQPDVVPQEKAGVEAESSSATNLMSAYLNLPHHLKCCLDYSYFVLSCSHRCRTIKERLAYLLLAEGLITEDNSSALKEDVASTVIDQLIGLEMLEREKQYFEWVRIPSTYQKLCIGCADRKNVFAEAPDSAIRLYLVDGGKDDLYPNLNGLTITSLFDLPDAGLVHEKRIPPAYMETICRLKSLVVLDLEGEIECIPDEIGDLVHLKYLCLGYYKFNDIPHSKTKSLQSFQMMFSHVDGVPAEALDIQRLWQIMMNRNITNSEARVSRKIGFRLNLHNISAIYARGAIMSELSKFTHLRRLIIYCVSEEHATELSAAIMRMTYLRCLTMYAERVSFGKESVEFLPELEAFSPPRRLQEVTLWGQLVDIPSWLFSMENLTILSLLRSYLHDDSIFLLQFLPNLKHLELGDASKEKQIGEGFCQAGGFPKLEVLSIYSTYLVRWSEIADGAFPSLRSLSFSNCENLMVLPNGLQNITTLDELHVFPIHGDLERRLQRNENYKIKNIPKVVFRSS